MRYTHLVSLTLALIVMTVGLVGCKGPGVLYQVRDAPIRTATGKQPSLEEVQKSIIAAGSGLGWQMTVVKPGEIIGTLNIRSHQAIVSIPFTTAQYGILYKDSTNLKYNAEKQTIHDSYSIWIQRLDKAIRSWLITTGL